jgi:hypothetical protein
VNKRAAQVVAAACLLCGAAAAPPAPPAAASRSAAPTEIAWLLGRWQGPGTFLGRPSNARLELRPALGDAFVELRYRVVTADGAAPTTFEGRAFYRREAEGWRARWFDSRGTSFPVTARLSGSEFVADWGTPQSERGRTLYRLGADGSLLVSDAVSGVDGGWREFARHRLVLQK